MICQRVHYEGRVQGVGFRYTTQSIARGFQVTGYVRNLDDGTVELVVQGTTEQVEAFLAAIAERMSDNIRGITASEGPAAEYAGFQITH